MLIYTLLTAGTGNTTCDSMAWPVYAPVEYTPTWDQYAAKTYFFMGVKGLQQPANVEAFKKDYDSVAQVTVGKVIRRDVPNQADETYHDTWFWWPVKEQDKTYLTCYILSYALKGSPMFSYYELEFKDGTKFKWTEPRITLYSFNDMFILLDGELDVTDYHDHSQHHMEKPADGLMEKMLTTPLYIVKKYDAYQQPNKLSDVRYYQSLQYVFSDAEAQQLMNSLQCMQ